jgi:hypothetical protein
MTRSAILASLAALTLCGCARFPELSGRVPQDVAARGYPALVPLDGLLADPVPPDAATVDAAAAPVAARAAALRARAAALRAPVLDAAARDRLAGGAPE